MNKFKNSLYRFLYGRYGMDQLNWLILIIIGVLLVLNSVLFKNSIVAVIIWVLMILEIYRCYSRKIYQRQKENNALLKFFHPVTKRFKLAKTASRDKDHKFFICPECKQNIRVPKGHGKIVITCPNCHHKFERRT